MIKIKTLDMEIALAKHFNYRINIIIPNVYWGLGLNYECDMLIVSKMGYATEIEIKISKSDIKADLKKKFYAHRSKLIKRFFYAVPESLVNCNLIPDDSGLISVDEHKCKLIKRPRINKFARKLNQKEINKLLHLGCMRIWNLKNKINKLM